MATMANDHGLDVDRAVLSKLPPGSEILAVTTLGLSTDYDTSRIDVRLADGSKMRYLEKASRGQHGFEHLRAHYTSESSMYSFIPENVPRPLAFVTHESNPNRHSFLMEFVDMIDELPTPEPFMATVAALHRRSAGKSPTGKFGFPVTTKFGHLTTPNTWDESWEVVWAQHMTNAFDREVQERGARTAEEDGLVDFYLKQAIPRYIRPLETDGRSIPPTLVHTNVWAGNVKHMLDNETVCLFDANAIWGHNEMELGLVANPRYPLGEAYIEEYWKHIPISEPEEDLDCRIIMYMIRHQVCIASVYPNDPKLRDVWVNSVQDLRDRYTIDERIKTNASRASNNASTVLGTLDAQPHTHETTKVAISAILAT
ncbi:Fructosamine kinase-domain-containing protein [Xylariaceae sp. FL1019]|nr:Fructosamine kinase-domain-containing protein [Xylariaceae sp. FL1019]